MFEKLRKLKNELIQEVPNALSACEICRKPECPNDEWETCEYRLRQKKRLDDADQKTKAT